MCSLLFPAPGVSRSMDPFVKIFIEGKTLLTRLVGIYVCKYKDS